MIETTLAVRLQTAIAQQGPLPFADFMQRALYDPQDGYYMTSGEKIGWSGDYFSSSDLHPFFGALLGRQMEEMWALLERPEPFTVLEMGAGKGLLCRDIWNYARFNAPAFAAALRYQIVEISPDLRLRQQSQVARLPAGVQARTAWVARLDELPAGSVTGCVLSNELIDAFPVHLIQQPESDRPDPSSPVPPQEMYVAVQAGRFVEEYGPLSTPALASYLRRYCPALAPGQRVEVNQAAQEWMAQVASVLARGFVLTLDYGDLAAQLYDNTRRHRGTLICYQQHTMNTEPLRRVGQQDITAHVNFSALIETGLAHGLEQTGFTTQRDFLICLGIESELEEVRRTSYSAHPRHTDAGQIEYLRFSSLKNSVKALLDPAGLGGFKVLAQHKGTTAPQLRGFAVMKLN